jgi:hypothetical protein
MHAMQFGGALQRLLQRIVYCNSQHGPPWMAKLDLADGYYRVPLSPLASLTLAVVLPGDGVHTHLIGLPLSLPMGWTHSPPYFCAYTETVTDIANATVNHTSLPKHPLEHTLHLTTLPQARAFTPDALLPLGQPSLPPLSLIDVYLDDFMAVAQPPRHTQTMRGLLHSIDAIFFDTPATSLRRSIISKSKIDKGDGSWSTRKTLLGWDIDTASMTLSLPPHRQQRLADLLVNIAGRRRVSRRKWQQLLGELRSMSLALPGAKFQFSLLQHALTQHPHTRIRLTSLLQAAITDWKHLLQQLQCPVPLHSVVPRRPDILTGCDASLLGVGGWIWNPAQPHTVYVWRHPFPTHIQRQVVTMENPNGTINNSELELVGIVLSAYMANSLAPSAYPMIWCASDNNAAVAWSNTGSTSSTAPSAFLLRLLGQLSLWTRFTLCSFYVSGATNTLADSLSRRFDLSWPALHDSCLATLAPQTSWEIVQPPSDALSQVTSALSRQIWPAGCPRETLTPNPRLGASGKTFAQSSTKILSSTLVRTPSPSYKSLPDAIEQAPWLPEGIRSQLRQWHAPFVPWGRRWPHWDSPTHGLPRKTPWIYGLPGNWQPMEKRIHRPGATSPFPSRCSGTQWNTASWPTHGRPKQ